MNDQEKPINSNEPSNQNGKLVTAMHYAGPLPPSSELERYERLAPGCANILIEMAQKNSEHRRSIEAKQIELHEKAIQGDIEHNRRRDSEALRGQLFAFILGFIALSIGAILGYLNHPIFASILTGIPFCTFLTAFVLGRTKDNS